MEVEKSSTSSSSNLKSSTMPECAISREILRVELQKILAAAARHASLHPPPNLGRVANVRSSIARW